MEAQDTYSIADATWSEATCIAQHRLPRALGFSLIDFKYCAKSCGARMATTCNNIKHIKANKYLLIR